MYTFRMVDWSVNNPAGQTHSSMTFTQDHIMELVCTWDIAIGWRRPVGSQMTVQYWRIWRRGDPGAVPRGVSAWTQSWPVYSKVQIPRPAGAPLPPTSTGPPNMNANKVAALRYVYQWNIARSPQRWSPTARDYHDYLWFCFAWFYHGVNDGGLMQGPGVGAHAGYQRACCWMLYQPSALSQYTGISPASHGAAWPALPAVGAPVGDQLVKPLSFTGGGAFRALLLNTVFFGIPAAVALSWTPVGGGPVEPSGMIDQLAWLLGLWLADGATADSTISQSDRGHPQAGGALGGDHTDAIRLVQHIARQMYVKLGQPAVPAGAGLAAGLAGAWTGAPVALGARPAPGTHAAGVQRERFQQVVPGVIAPFTPFNPRQWILYPALHGGAGNWFRQLLFALGLQWNAPAGMGIQGRKHWPMLLLADTPTVRRHLLAGYVDGDAHLFKQGYKVGTARDRPMADGFMHIARGLGYTVGKRTDTIAWSVPTVAQWGPPVHPRINLATGMIGHDAWSFVCGGVPDYGGADPNFIPVRMPYRRLNAGVPDRNSYGYSCVPKKFSGLVPAPGGGVAKEVRHPHAQEHPVSPYYVQVTVEKRDAFGVALPLANQARMLLSAEAIVLHNCTARDPSAAVSSNGGVSGSTPQGGVAAVNLHLN